ncbi:MAG: hypothetical protein ACRDNS_26440 [Trebonia sp.]
MNDPDRAMTWHPGMGDELPEQLWAPLGLTADEEPLRPGPVGGLVSLAFIREALGRAKWVWCVTAVFGLLIGFALYLRYPPAYHAQASVLVVDVQGADPEVQVLTDQSIAQSQPVAAEVVRQLGLRQSVASFQAAYSVTVVTPNVLTFNVGAPSTDGAVRRAAALASSFLQYRAQQERSQEQRQATLLNQQYSQAEQSLNAIEAQLGQLPTSGLTSTQQAQLARLQSQAGNQRQIMQIANTTATTNKAATETLVSGSYALNPARLVTQSRVKATALYLLGGLFGGLVVGLAIVIIAALLSDRLRRRDDVAAALGAPVRLSVGSLRVNRLLPVRPRRKARRNRDMKRVIAYLHGAVSGSHRGPASLAVVAVDETQEIASAIAALAHSRASEGKLVVVADLSARQSLARLLGAKASGVHQVTRDGVRLQVAVPERDDIAPVGPLQDGPRAPWAQPDEAVVSACASADLLLSLVTLDPAMGGDHLATWASEAVAVVTAGCSSAERVHGVGEMIRLAGTRFKSAVLIGADRTDESLGLLEPPRSATDGTDEGEPTARERGEDGIADGGGDRDEFLP